MRTHPAGSKRKAALVGAAAVALLLAGTALAAKPVDVIEWSNGFPSGPHHNLNIHGKKETFDCSTVEPGGGSVFVLEYGGSTIHYVMNKKSSFEGLAALDPCAEAFDGDPAKVQIESGEYQVYWRALAKPTKDGEETRSVIVTPSLVEACNESVDSEDFANETSCTNEDEELVGAGVITKDGAFKKTSDGLERVAPTGKGKNTATNVSELFLWSGWACDASLDTNDDGEITEDDVPGDFVGTFEDWLAANCTEFTDEWVFNIADLVVYGWDYQNSGMKLVQLRFYPNETTVYE